MYNNNSDQIVADASNIKNGTNPAYTVSDFLTMYPGFGNNSPSHPNIPTAILQVFVDLATATIKQSRFYGAWAVIMGYFIAHFATLWLQSTADPTGGASAVLEAGRTNGLITSESVGDISVSIDYNTLASGLEGWVSWLSTEHGKNLVMLARLYGKGGMVVR